MSGEVCYFDHTMQGAPTLRGTNGDMIGLLDACLVNGFGNVAISSMTRSGAVVTVTTGSAHGFSMLGQDGSHDGIGPVVEISGANESDYNGRWRVVSVTSTTVFTFNIGVLTPATPATGSMSVKRAPAGFGKAFSGTNKGVYRGPVGTTRMYWRVDDGTGTPKWSYCRGYETMSDVDTGTGPFPTTSQQANGLLHGKSDTADSTARPWAILADEAAAYVFTSPNSNASGGFLANYFGDIADAQKPGDAYHCYLTGSFSNGSGSNPSSASNDFVVLMNTISSSKLTYAPRSYAQTGTAVAAGYMGIGTMQGNIGNGGMTYPAPNNSGFYQSPIAVVESNTIRGYMPGLYSPLHTMPFSDGDIVADVVGYAGRYFLARRLMGSSGTVSYQGMFDLTGPWR